MGYFTDKWELKVRDYCDSQYELIQVLPGDFNFYHKCHLVATHYAVKNKDEKLALVMYRPTNSTKPLVHFINYDGKDFVDNTVGVWSNTYEYRFIRWVDRAEDRNTPQILVDTHKFFLNMATFMERLFGKLSN